MKPRMDKFDLEGFLPYQLSVLSRRISGDFARLYQSRFGISMAEWRVIATLSNEGKVSVREIHEHVDMDKSKVSRAAARLQAAGLVAKNICKKDRRLIELELTDAGCEMMRGIGKIAAQYQQTLLARMDGAEAQTLGEVITKLLNIKEN